MEAAFGHKLIVYPQAKRMPPAFMPELFRFQSTDFFYRFVPLKKSFSAFLAFMQFILISLTALLLLFTVLPLIRHDHWTFRVFEYPRIQKLALSIALFFLVVFFLPSPLGLKLVLLALIAANGIYLLYQVYPFTPVAPKQVYAAKAHRQEDSISLMIANVYEDNDNYEGCVKEVLKADADVVLLLETNAAWDKGTQALARHYAHSVKVPQENTYGMLLYSRLPLQDERVNYLVEDDIPSIHAKVQLNSGKLVQLHAVHPTPPVPNENPRSTERDKELLLVADKAKKTELPVLVIGDLNDVAWSYTTELFLKMSGLLDPRRGRGFFNTFHAHYPFMRFPLDHAFCSADFRLHQLKRMDNFGSDHFPIYIALQYDPVAKKEQKVLKPDEEDITIAREKKMADTDQ